MSNITQKLGQCVLCGSRVHSDENYLKSREGYCHKDCINDAPITA